MTKIKQETKEAVSEYVIKAIFYSKPRMVTNTNGEVVAGRYGVIYMVGQITEIAGSKWRKVSRIVYSKEIDGFQIHFDDTSKEYPYKGLITVPRLQDTEVYYEINEI